MMHYKSIYVWTAYDSVKNITKLGQILRPKALACLVYRQIRKCLRDTSKRRIPLICTNWYTHWLTITDVLFLCCLKLVILLLVQTFGLKVKQMKVTQMKEK
jgi:hypothetical protein